VPAPFLQLANNQGLLVIITTQLNTIIHLIYGVKQRKNKGKTCPRPFFPARDQDKSPPRFHEARLEGKNVVPLLDSVWLPRCNHFGEPAEIERRVLEKTRAGWEEILPKPSIDSGGERRVRILTKLLIKVIKSMR